MPANVAAAYTAHRTHITDAARRIIGAALERGTPEALGGAFNRWPHHPGYLLAELRRRGALIDPA